MRRTIWGSVALFVAVMAGAAYLPRAISVLMRDAGARWTVAEVRDRIAAGSAVAARAMELGIRVRLARAASAARHAALAGSARIAPANAWLQRAALDLSIQGAVAARGIRRDPEAVWPAALVAGGLILAAAAGGAWSRLRRGSVSRRAVSRLARRGESCARIARRTRLAQDAVRSMTGGSARAHGSLG